MLAEMNEAWYSEDQILQRGEKPFFTVFSMRKFFEHNITKNLEVDDLHRKKIYLDNPRYSGWGGPKDPLPIFPL